MMGSVSKSSHDDDVDSPGVEKLKQDLDNRLPFHENRWMCLTQPTSAVLCLGAVARLEVTIVKAKDLILNEGTGVAVRTEQPKPFVRVYLDDKEVAESTRGKNTRNPDFNYSCNIDVVAAKSMVRFQVYDKDIEDDGARDLFKANMAEVSVVDGKKQSSLQHSLGFVEVCLADMPFDEELIGWLELRFPSHLQGKNTSRYHQHCLSREDVLHKEMQEMLEAAPSSQVGHMAFVQVSKKISRESGTSGYGGMMKSVMGRARTTRDESADQQFNAGELFVRMKMVMAAPSKYDVMFSYALDPPKLSFNPVIQASSLPELDIQELFDDAMDIKFSVLDDFVFCFFSYVWYLLSWQNKFVSGLITLCLLLSCWSKALIHGCVFGIMAALLLMNCREGQRQQMTTSGLNAPLTQKGFLIVARWNSILQMQAFIYRVMMHQGCQVLSERGLHDFVARGFRDLLDPSRGFEEDDTSLTLPDIVRVLKKMDWVAVNKKDVDEAVLKERSMVRIQERRRATVSRVLPPEIGEDRTRFVVQYDELDGTEENETEVLYADQLNVRTVMPKIPKYMISGKIQENIRKLAWQIDYGKHLAIIPALHTISDVMTWKIPLATFSMFAFCVFQMVIHVVSCFLPEGSFSNLIWLSQNMGTFVLAAVLIVLFIVFAHPLGWIVPMFRMVKEWMTRKRTAPDIWPFFTRSEGSGEASLVLDVRAMGSATPISKKDGAGSTSPKRVWSMIANTSSRDGGPEAESVNSEAPLLQPGPKRSSWLPRFSRSSAAKP